MTLTVTLSGLGEGTVGVVGSDAILCPANCSEAYPSNTSVVLIATPFAGFQFDGWDGECIETNTSTAAPAPRTCKIELSENRTIDAKFSIRTHALKITTSEHGRIRSSDELIDCVSPSTPASKCAARINYGRRVTLAAEPDPGYRMVEWGVDCLGKNSCAFTMIKDRTVTAEFEEDIVSVQITKTGTGAGSIISMPAAIDCGSICTTQLLRDQTLLLTATPAPNSRFAGWNGLCFGRDICALTARDDLNEVSAKFVLEEYTLDVSNGGQGLVVSTPPGINCGNGNMACSARFVSGTEVVLDATPPEGYELDTWTGDCAGNASCLLSMTSNKTANVSFVPALYDLTVSVLGVGQGSVTSTPAGILCPSNCQATFAHGTAVRLTPEPAPGSQFTRWSGSCSGTDVCELVITDFDIVTAEFDIQRHDIVVSLVGLGSGSITSDPIAIDCPANDCSTTFDHTVAVSLEATPETGSVFVGWEGACEGTGICQFESNASKSVAARFEREYAMIAVREFTLGSTLTDSGTQANEQPQAQVAFSGNFWMKKTEVTHGEWEKIMGTSVTSFPGCGVNCPIENMSFEQATQYLNRLSDLDNYPRCYTGNGANLQFITGCLGYRLPSAAEWEYAARAGSAESFSDYGLSNNSNTCGVDSGLSNLGWYCSNANSNIHNVAQKLPNSFGLYDMHGNVAEWTQDYYDPAHYSTISGTTVDPTGTSTSSLREVRGGHWASIARDCRSASRNGADPNIGTNTIGFRPVRSAFTRVPAGQFTMGSTAQSSGHQNDEAPQHSVFISRPYWVQETETTQAEYSAAIGFNPSSNTSCGDLCPVEQISYDQALTYLNQRSIQAGLFPCYQSNGSDWIYHGAGGCSGYRLLSEAEWERAARANTDTAFFAGDISSLTCSDTTLNQIAWYCANSSSSSHEVAQKPANDFGLHDVHGNVSEWVNDYYSSVYYTSNPIEDPEGPSSGTARVVRGGYYNASAAECRSSARGSQQANSAIANVGIRVARADSEQCQQAEATNVSSAPPGRLAPELVWTGHEVLVLGGEPSSSSIGLPAFSPFENEWSIASGLNAPELDRIGHGVAWTGEEALIWGGERLNMVISDGGAYHESKDLWRSMISNLKSPSPRSHFAHHWLCVLVTPFSNHHQVWSCVA